MNGRVTHTVRRVGAPPQLARLARRRPVRPDRPPARNGAAALEGRALALGRLRARASLQQGESRVDCGGWGVAVAWERHRREKGGRGGSEKEGKGRRGSAGRGSRLRDVNLKHIDIEPLPLKVAIQTCPGCCGRPQCHLHMQYSQGRRQQGAAPLLAPASTLAASSRSRARSTQRRA